MAAKLPTGLAEDLERTPQPLEGHMDFLNGKRQVFLGPKENGASDDLEQVIVDFIAAAQFSLRVAVQEVDNQKIADALERAARRKQPDTDRNVGVRFVTEGDYLVEANPVEPPNKVVSLDTNRALLAQLLRGAVDSKIDFNPKIFHQSSSFATRGSRARPS
jgi:hypothetical protein